MCLYAEKRYSIPIELPHSPFLWSWIILSGRQVAVLAALREHNCVCSPEHRAGKSPCESKGLRKVEGQEYLHKA